MYPRTHVPTVSLHNECAGLGRGEGGVADEDGGWDDGRGVTLLFEGGEGGGAATAWRYA